VLLGALSLRSKVLGVPSTQAEVKTGVGTGPGTGPKVRVDGGPFNDLPRSEHEDDKGSTTLASVALGRLPWESSAARAPLHLAPCHLRGLLAFLL